MNSQYDEPTQLFASATRHADFQRPEVKIPVAIIACHPDPNRLGEFAGLEGLAHFKEQELNRSFPEFHSSERSIGRGLGVPQVSRKSLRFEYSAEADLILYRQDYSAPVHVNGNPLNEWLVIHQHELEQGIELSLGEHVMLFIRSMPMPEVVLDDLGLVGISQSMQNVRERILKVAAADEPVLIRGATGCGKELVAQALRRQSARHKKPFVTVNIAALQQSLAASEMFGSVKGAFTGSTDDRKGYFQAANTGTLFLDEIGEASQEVQAMLLRALENHEVVPVGKAQAVPVDVRIIAATDADLELGGQGTFKQPLLHRLSSYQIFLPPLNERKEDIPGLLQRFLRTQMETLYKQTDLPVSVERPVLNVTLMHKLMNADWPGNVRQLLNVARELLLYSRGDKELRLDADLANMIEAKNISAAQPMAQTAPAKRKPSQVTREELESVLVNKRYELQASADELGISRASMYKLIERHPSLRNTADFSEQDLKEAYDNAQGDVEVMMNTLKVSQIGLRRRLRAMGLNA